MSAVAWIITFLAIWTGLSFVSTGYVVADPMAAIALVLLVLVIVLGVYHWRNERALLQMLRRGLTVLVPILLVLSIPIGLLILHDGLDIRLRQAILAGLIIMAGWLTTFVLQEERRLSDRTDRRLDTLIALQSETYNILSKIDNQAIKKTASEVQQKMRTGGMGPFAYVPFSTSESPPIVFTTVSESVPLLKPATLRPVLRFYAEYEDLRSLIADMRAPDYHGLSPERRVDIHKELIRRRIVTLRWAMAAQIAVNRALGMSEDKARSFERSGLNQDILPAEDE